MMDSPLARWGDASAFLMAFILAVGGTVLVVHLLIPVLERLQLGQRVRDDGPRRHLAKMGTPTMGGLGLVFSILLITLLALPRDPAVWILVAVVVAAGGLGFADDFLKVARDRPLGLKGRWKLLGQLVLGAALGGFMAYGLDMGTVIAAPRGLFAVDLGWTYPAFTALLMVSATNAVNLTDGLDGLAAGGVALALPVFVMAALARGQLEVGLFGLVVLGATVGFLWHNFHPARVFMGDTGSLALGGFLAAIAIVTRTELILLLAGGLFVVETLSVIAQVLYFRTSGGQRLLKMSPLHHHLELSGFGEITVVLMLWGFQGACALLAVWGLGGMGT